MRAGHRSTEPARSTYLPHPSCLSFLTSHHLSHTLTLPCLCSAPLTTQWDTSEHAGFSKSIPWMRVHDDYAQGWNVAQQVNDEKSVWRFWQRMLKLRKEYEALVYGESAYPTDRSLQWSIYA